MAHERLNIAFHGQNASQFRAGFEQFIGDGHRIVQLSDALQGQGEQEQFEQADVIVGIRLNAQMPQPRKLRLYHAPAAGVDAIDARVLPATSSLCNCFLALNHCLLCI